MLVCSELIPRVPISFIADSTVSFLEESTSFIEMVLIVAPEATVSSNILTGSIFGHLRIRTLLTLLKPSYVKPPLG